ncbi:MAG: hypothetical protein KGS72_08725 [Cyanobacteria bacterium REEB67]|nr:hypothetical protein [Cyanobacteria bacterium REEB67]
MSALCALSMGSGCEFLFGPALAVDLTLFGGKGKPQKRDFPIAVFEKLSDPSSEYISPDAVQLAEAMNLVPKLRRLMILNERHHALAPGESLSTADRVERTELRFDVLESVEEARLQIDFIIAEIEEEQAILNEAMRLFSSDRDARVNRANILAFRTNGALWAVAEALTIPSYKYPRYSIPSGAVGIVAGVVPSIFSIYATRSLNGGQYERHPYPNILSKIYDFPTIPRIEYPEIVWKYLNSCPHGQTRTRREIIKANWYADENIHIFKDGPSLEKLRKLTGNEPYTADMNLVSDKLIMSDQIKAVTLQMSRPLLEICMVARGRKKFVDQTGSVGSDPTE